MWGDKLTFTAEEIVKAARGSVAVVSKNSFLKAYFLRRKREGLPSQKALFATAHKLLRVIFAMLTQRTYFSPKEVI